MKAVTKESLRRLFKLTETQATGMLRMLKEAQRDEKQVPRVLMMVASTTGDCQTHALTRTEQTKRSVCEITVAYVAENERGVLAYLTEEGRFKIGTKAERDRLIANGSDDDDGGEDDEGPDGEPWD